MNLPISVRTVILLTLATATTAYYIYSKQNPSDKPQSEQKVSIAIISDIDRCKTRAFASSDNLSRFTDFANTRSVDLAVSLGDNIAHRLENCTETAEDDLNFVMNAFSALSMPMHYVLGDHDISNDPESYAYWLEKTKKDATYYSFDQGDVHIVVLDTVTGGSSMLPCGENGPCEELQAMTANLLTETEKNVDIKTKDQKKINAEVFRNTQKITRYKEQSELIKSDTVRDQGLLEKDQLLWLVHDLATTDKSKILVLADHPLFQYTTRKKRYEIDGLSDLAQILEDTQANGKKVVGMFGETHTWVKRTVGGVEYYGINQFRAHEGSWALLEWDTEPRVYRIKENKIDRQILDRDTNEIKEERIN